MDAANQSLDALYVQNGLHRRQTARGPPVPTAPPRAAARLPRRKRDLHQLAGLYTPEVAMAARIDDPFIHVRDSSAKSESRYEPLYAIAQPITGSATLPVHASSRTSCSCCRPAFGLRDQLDAMERLKGQSTARLERTFADHVDCCSYRLDAWILGMVNYQLALMRNLRDGQQDPPRRGVHLGAYAWLEDLRPEHKELVPVRITDTEVREDFAKASTPLMRDPTNQGYIHAPSLNHAVAAAVLRNGFISNATRANRQTMAVNLTSERVRIALGLLEGIRAGQGLGDLLGYQFERGLHDRHGARRGRQVHLQAAQGVSAAGRSPEVHADRRRRVDRSRSKPATCSTGSRSSSR